MDKLGHLMLKPWSNYMYIIGTFMLKFWSKSMDDVVFLKEDIEESG